VLPVTMAEPEAHAAIVSTASASSERAVLLFLMSYPKMSTSAGSVRSNVRVERSALCAASAPQAR
jgi:hypothetical protein